MVLDKPLGVGARGGHGPIRYYVEEFDPGRRVVFRFTSPPGFHGTHGFQVEASGVGCELHHTLDMRVSGSALVTWPFVLRPLHDSLLEDALDKVEANLSDQAWIRRELPPFVKVLRKMLARSRRKTA
jgi:hypothetical protein